MTTHVTFFAERLSRIRGEWRHLPRAIGLIRQAAGPWTGAWVVVLAAQGLLPAATVFLTRWVVDALVVALRHGGSWTAVRPALLPAALMGGAWVVSEALAAVQAWLRTVQGELVRDYIAAVILQKSIDVDLAFYDAPDYYDHLHRAREEACYRPIELLEGLGSLLQGAVTMVAMAAVLVPFGLWLPAALVLSTVPALVVVMRYAVRRHHWLYNTVEDERRARYYEWMLTTRETAGEVRLFALGPRFLRRFSELRSRLRGERASLERGQCIAELAAGMVGATVSGAALAWAVWQALHGRGTLGGIALLYQAFTQGQGLMRTLLGNVARIYANSLFLGNLFEFLSLDARVVDPPAPELLPDGPKGVRFSGVSFRYPGSKRVALDGFDLEVKAGQVAAIVGANGVGKSTLLKLLCRFYDPQAGTVELGGTDVRMLSADALRRTVTVLFQEPVRYSATVAENIAVGRVDEEVSRSDIEAAARAAGADEVVDQLPCGYDSLLGRWFRGGTDLSSGQWQRIALARAFVRGASVVLLDEPTSAMDSWAEDDWLRRFRTLAGGKTVMLITHRFTTAMRADVIHVMEAGRIVESGTHEELVSRGGRYAASWRSQLEAGGAGAALTGGR